MGEIRGKGGRVYALGAPHQFHDLPLRSDDGWDWQAPEDMRCWLPDEVTFETRGASQAGVMEIHHHSGRVCLDKNVAGGGVYATGTAIPTTLVADGLWLLETDVAVADATTLGDDHQHSRARSIGATATVFADYGEPIKGDVLAVLPTVGERAFVGIGKPTVLAGRVKVRFDPERITHGYR